MPIEERKVKFTDPIRKNKPLTFSSLYQCNTRNKAAGSKEKALKADRYVLQRLVMAYDAGRKVDLMEILKHELLPVPLSLTEMNGTLRTGSKSILCDVLLDSVQCPPSLTDDDISQDATLIIDGKALVVSLGKTTGTITFGDLADVFVKSVLTAGSKLVVFKYYLIDITNSL